VELNLKKERALSLPANPSPALSTIACVDHSLTSGTHPKSSSLSTAYGVRERICQVATQLQEESREKGAPRYATGSCCGQRLPGASARPRCMNHFSSIGHRAALRLPCRNDIRLRSFSTSSVFLFLLLFLSFFAFEVSSQESTSFTNIILVSRIAILKLLPTIRWRASTCPLKCS
jgi:hypothetical protein